MTSWKLDSGWVAAPLKSVAQTGEELTTSSFPSLQKTGWMEAVVPGTILTTMLKNNLIPDPFYGMENENVPDIADAGREFYTFWFCNSFTPPESEYTIAWLQFRAINYSADVFVNGHKTSLTGGMFLRRNLNISAWIKPNEVNYLAVLVHPPDHPGWIPPEGGQGGDHQIAKDVAAQYVEGWDWIIPIRDRNTGLWDDVSLLFTGPVQVRDPHLVTTFNDNFTTAYLHASTELVNSTSKDAQCTVKIQVSFDVEDDFSSVEHVYSAQLMVQGGANTLYTFPKLVFNKPQLWWPNGMGKQPLYKVDIAVEVDEDKESDMWSHRIGFRLIETYIDSSTGGRLFKVNGKPLFIRGGNWIVSDGLLRLSEERYRTEIGFHADMNMNMIRIWAGALAERPPFYDACDERGLLVWQEFWITGDNNGRAGDAYLSDHSWPLDHELFLTCARDTVKMLRNHASLAMWCGGNEQVPPEDINNVLKAELVLNPTFQTSNSTKDSGQGSEDLDLSHYLDGTRVYIEGSLWSGFADGQGNFTDGPYGIQNPEAFFAEDFYPYGFNPEIGSIGVPKAATMRASMPREAWELPAIVEAEDGYVTEVPNATWVYHKYLPYSDAAGKVRHQIVSYGKPKNLDDFCSKAQLVNYVQYRALFESWNSRMWEKYTGILIWKNQNPWFGLRGGLFDFLHDQTGGFFGIQSAAEPVHIQLNLATHFVEIVNTTDDTLQDVIVEASIWDLEGTSLFKTTFKQLSSPSFKTFQVLKIPAQNLVSAEVYFVLLKMFKDSNVEVSRNFYWLHKPDGDYSSLEGEFQTKKVPIEVSANATQADGYLQIVAQVKNVSEAEALLRSPRSNGPLANSISRVAFWMHFSVLLPNDGTGDPQEDLRLLPVTYSSNYFSLVPGEHTTVEISFKKPIDGEARVLLQGWNIDDVQVAY